MKAYKDEENYMYKRFNRSSQQSRILQKEQNYQFCNTKFGKKKDKKNKTPSESQKNKHQPIFDEQKGQMVCCKCGIVLSERQPVLKNGTRAFSHEERERKKHHGNPINSLLPDIQMATMVKKRNAKTKRLRHALKWDTRYTWKQRNLIKAISEIRRLGTKLSLPQYIQESSADLYKRLYKRNLLKGRSIKSMVSSVIYYVTNKNNVCRPIDEIVKYSNVPQRKIHNCYQIILDKFNLRSPVINPRYLVSRPVTELNLDSRVEKITQEILNLYKKMYSFSGLDPKGIVGAALYFAVKNQDVPVTQSQIANEVGVTEVTMRKRFKEIKKMVAHIRKAKKKKETQ